MSGLRPAHLEWRPHVGLSAIVADNIRQIREGTSPPRLGERKLSRPEFADLLNRAGQPPGDPARPLETSDTADDRPRWDDQAIIRLEHAAGPKAKPKAIPIDDLLSVCQALQVSLFDLVLPDQKDSRFSSVSLPLFGFDLSPSTVAWFRKRAIRAHRLRFHPRVADAVFPFEVARYSADLLGDRRYESDRLIARDTLTREKVETLLAAVDRHEIEPPTEDQAELWEAEFHQKVLGHLIEHGLELSPSRKQIHEQHLSRRDVQE